MKFDNNAFFIRNLHQIGNIECTNTNREVRETQNKNTIYYDHTLASSLRKRIL